MIDKRMMYIDKINQIAKESFNDEQKKLAISILEVVDSKILDATYDLISQRVKTGFVFDSAPEVNHDCVALIEENHDLNIESLKKGPRYVEHKLIIGENYDALKNLAASYVDPITNKGMVDVIYIDPPYGTEKAKEDGNDYKTHVESVKFIYRDKYTRDGWLNLMKERLLLSKKVLTDEGIIFVSIDDNNQAYLKVLMDEIFGEENFITTFLWNQSSGGSSLSKFIRSDYEYILCYSKNKDLINYKFFSRYSEGMGDSSLINKPNKYSKLLFKKGTINFTSDQEGLINAFTDQDFELHNDLRIENSLNANDVYISAKWKWSQDYLDEQLSDGTKILSKTQKLRLRYIRDNEGDVIIPTKSITSSNGVGYTTSSYAELTSMGLGFDYAKPTSLIKYLVNMVTYNNKDAIILDYFAGSGTTGQAVMELNAEDNGQRKFILVTNNENNIAVDITRERLYRVINGKGSNDEAIKWTYSKDLPSLVDNEIRVFDINYHELTINDFEKAEKLADKAAEQFKLLNEGYKKKNELDIYYDLSSLNPIDKVME
jgi:adenine-specific DNA-methyltransferase